MKSCQIPHTYFHDPGILQDLFYREGWEYILEKHEGRLPVKIKAVLYPVIEQALPEGTVQGS